jgi:hypothetical protein
MSKLLIISLLSTVAITAACGSSSTSSNVNASNATTAGSSNANLPPEFNPQPIQPSANATPGIPAPNSASNKIPPNTPGINPANAVRTLRPGEKIPGIDPEAVRRQMANANAAVKQSQANKLPPVNK